MLYFFVLLKVKAFLLNPAFSGTMKTYITKKKTFSITTVFNLDNKSFLSIK